MKKILNFIKAIIITVLFLVLMAAGGYIGTRLPYFIQLTIGVIALIFIFWTVYCTLEDHNNN